MRINWLKTSGRLQNVACKVVTILLLAGASICAETARAQTQGLLQIDDALHEYLERQRTLGRLPDAHLTHKPLSAYEADRYLNSLRAREAPPIPPPDSLADDPPPTSHVPRPTVVTAPIGPFYRNGRDVLAFGNDEFALHINPLLLLAYGTANGHPTWQNTRGLRASGRVGPHIFFESRLEEVQVRPAIYQFDRLTAPRRPFVRVYGDSTAYDYQVATGVVGFRSNHFEVRFGRDQNQWGTGENSLLLSDYAPVYDQLQIRTSFWRLQYVNLFAGLSNPAPFGHVPPNVVVPRKFGAFHHLSVNVTDRITIEIFESVIFGPDSTIGRDARFDLAYLNPIIFYRAVEADRGSPDNVLFGGGASWIVWPGIKIYGQGILDEFVFSELFTSSWRNRWGFLAGIHVVPIETLSIRAEAARLRPFLYTHRNSTTAYLHYLDAIGHPAGPNSADYGLFLDWNPTPRWHAALHASYTVTGQNDDGNNAGSDPRVSFDTRAGDRVAFLGGARRSHALLEAFAGYEILPDVYAELVLRAETVDDVLGGDTSYIQPFISLRWGLPFPSVRF